MFGVFARLAEPEIRTAATPGTQKLTVTSPEQVLGSEALHT
jgi:hypothetical protein